MYRYIVNYFRDIIPKKQIWLLTGLLVFIITNAILLSNEWYYLALLPFLLLILYLATFSLDKLIYLVVFFVPISIPLEMYAPSLGFNLQLPTEPILAGILLLFTFRFLHEKKFNREILLHPVSLAIYFNLGWIFMTSLTSSMPLVSFKFLISRLWFVVPFYFIATQLFDRKKNIRQYVWIFIPLMVVVIGSAMFHMVQAGLFNQQAAHRSANPFFKDHTSYGCVLAMLLPFSIGFALSRKHALPFRLLSWFLVFIISFALLLSYTRAAWISIIVAGVLFIIMYLRIKLSVIVILGLLASLFLFTNRTEIFLDLKQNRQKSSKDLVKHIKSMSNIRNDESNVERLNRWESAYRMFKERPFWGWGPGTYMFQYAPFQVSYEKTSISTNMGNMGNAHSEYIGPLAESGIFGFISFVLICLTTVYVSIRAYIKARGHRETQILIFSSILGLVTYYVHGGMNDFLDMDKASVLFWGYTAMIVSLDVYHVKKYDKTSSIELNS